MKQKWMSLLLALTLTLTMFGGTAYAADTTLTVSAPDPLPAVGETFTVEVRISNNPGLCAAQFTLAFDPAVVSCQSAQLGSVLSGTLSAVNPNAPGGAILAAASSDLKEGDGVLGVFTFRVVGRGEPDFALKDDRFSDASGKTLPISVAGSGPVSQQPTETETQKPEAPKPETQKPESTDPAQPRFSDVPATFWSYGQIQRAAELGLIGGYADGTFRPNASVTRAQFVTMLWRLAGRPEASAAAPFTDTVGLNADFRAAINWAAEQGVVKGVTATEFRPGAPVNRQQALTILFRYQGGVSGMELLLAPTYDAQFTDSGSISASLKPGVYWAVYHGIAGGVTKTTLAPRGTATRAQIAVILMRYVDKML